MATTSFPEFLRFRAGLLGDYRGLPGLLAPPVPQPASLVPPQPPAQSGGLGSVLGTIFGGADDPNLTPEQNQAARRQALIQAGLGILASEKRGLGAIGEGGLYGQQVGQQARQAIYGRTQQERISQALRDPAIVGMFPPNIQRILPYLPPDQVLGMIAKASGPEEGVVVGNNLIGKYSGKVLYEGVDKPPADIQTFREFLNMKPEEQNKYLAYLDAKRGPGTTVNVGGPEGAAQQAIGKGVADIISGDKAAKADIQSVQNIDRIIEIVNNPKFKKVSGPLFGNTFGELAAKFSDDPEARELLAEFNALGGQMTMDRLAQFTGPKSNFEFQQARRLAFNDPKMTPDQIAAGLSVFRQLAIQNAKGWSKNMLNLDPKLLKFDPRTIAPQLDLAKQIQDLDPNAKADPLGIR